MQKVRIIRAQIRNDPPYTPAGNLGAQAGVVLRMNDAARPAPSLDIDDSILRELAEQRRLLLNQYQRNYKRTRYADDPEYRARELARQRGKNREAHRRLDGPERLLRSARLSSKRKGYAFDLDLDFVRSIYPADGVCPILGFRMLLDGERDLLPSLDRIDASEGYTKGNVRVISFRANRLKSDAWDWELRKIADYIVAPDPLTYVSTWGLTDGK